MAVAPASTAVTTRIVVTTAEVASAKKGTPPNTGAAPFTSTGANASTELPANPVALVVNTSASVVPVEADANRSAHSNAVVTTPSVSRTSTPVAVDNALTTGTVLNTAAATVVTASTEATSSTVAAVVPSVLTACAGASSSAAARGGAGVANVGAGDVGVGNVGVGNVGVVNVGVGDMGVGDMGVGDTGAADTGAGHTGGAMDAMEVHQIIPARPVTPLSRNGVGSARGSPERGGPVRKPSTRSGVGSTSGKRPAGRMADANTPHQLYVCASFPIDRLYTRLCMCCRTASAILWKMVIFPEHILTECVLKHVGASLSFSRPILPRYKQARLDFGWRTNKAGVRPLRIDSNSAAASMSPPAPPSSSRKRTRAQVMAEESSAVVSWLEWSRDGAAVPAAPSPWNRAGGDATLYAYISAHNSYVTAQAAAGMAVLSETPLDAMGQPPDTPPPAEAATPRRRRRRYVGRRGRRL